MAPITNTRKVTLAELILMVSFCNQGAQAREEDCHYECIHNGSCHVTYVGPPRTGRTQGSCFPRSFGGSCSGTPAECIDCNLKITCNEGGSGNTGANVWNLPGGAGNTGANVYNWQNRYNVRCRTVDLYGNCIPR